jgi:hypothetical protein
MQLPEAPPPLMSVRAAMFLLSCLSWVRAGAPPLKQSPQEVSLCSQLIYIVEQMQPAACPDDAAARIQEENALRKIRERVHWLGCNVTAQRPQPHWHHAVVASASGAAMWALVSPYTTCPWTLEKEPSVATVHDGGKWTCGLRELGGREDCVVYSFGSRGELDFEDTVRRHSSCTIHVFDPTKPPTRPSTSVTGDRSRGFHFHPVGLSHRDGNATIQGISYPVRTLESLMRDLGHGDGGVDILKIDVEGSEFSVVHLTDWSRLKIGQLLMEVHPTETMEVAAKVRGPIRDEPDLRRSSTLTPVAHSASWLALTDRQRARAELGMCDTCPFTSLQLNAFILQLERGGLRLFSTEPVSKIESKVELAMLHPRWHPRGGFSHCTALHAEQQTGR